MHGADLLKGKRRILTICNTGTLATGGIGTALGIIKVKHSKGDLDIAYLCETRPVLQGARLSAWELLKENVPHYIITDNAAPYLMSLVRWTLWWSVRIVWLEMGIPPIK